MNLSDVLNVDIEAEAVHIANKKWWIDIRTGEPIERDRGDQLMLVTTELSEAMEGARKNLMDDHLPQYKMEHVEIIDAFIRELDYRYGHGIREPFIYEDYPGAPIGLMSGKLRTFGDTLMTINGAVVKQHEHDARYIDYANGLVKVSKSKCDWVINMLYWYACWRKFDHLFLEIYTAKMAYNATRVDHSIEHRLGEHGKKI